MRFHGFKKWVSVLTALMCAAGTTGWTTTISADSVSAGIASDNTVSVGTASDEDSVSISWWICPTGDYADEASVQALVDAFEKENPQIDVTFRILDAETGAAQIGAAIEAADEKEVPDVVLCDPEWIVTQWGGEGLMADLTELWDEETQSEFRAEMRDASKNRDGVWYAVPIFRDLYTMAINYEMFAQAGALQYLNEEVHSWKDNGFIDCVLRVHDTLDQSGADSSVVGRVYCRNQNGQRAFMCFVSNFFKTGLVDDYRSSYQIGKSKICNVFGTLRKLVGKGIEFDSQMDGDDENAAFLRGDVFLTFNWNAAKQKAAKDAGFTVFPMMYPNAKNVPTLTGPIGALGVVEKPGREKEAAVAFVRYLMTDEDAYTDAVTTSGCFAARRRMNGHELTNLYGDDETMALYEVLNEYYESYDPVMELFPQFEQAWPEAVRKIAEGAKIKSVLKNLGNYLNGELEEKYGIHEIEVEEEEE